MSISSTTERVEGDAVTLRGGLRVGLDVLRFAWNLEERGVHLRIDGEALVARPRQLLSRQDVEFLERHRVDLRRLIAYSPPEF